MNRLAFPVPFLLLSLLFRSVLPAFAQQTGALDYAPAKLIVSSSGPYTTIQAALDAARPGDQIEVHPGVYAGPLIVDKTVALLGIDEPVIDGGGVGTVVTLAASDIVFRGFQVRGSGIEPDQDHAGITLTAPRIVVENNHLTDVLFGIFVAQADDSIVRRNTISSKASYETGRKGDGIRLWYSQRVHIEENHVYQARDIVLWYSKEVKVSGNRIEAGRYGIHLMYCDGATIERNHILRNSVGIYTMYSNNVVLQENDIRGQRGPSGYGLGFKDADNILTSGNLLADNRVGIYVDGTPFTAQGFAKFRENIVAYNDIGVVLLPAVKGNLFESNTFWENIEQMSVQGSGGNANIWQGNTWSDYAGFDADGDGQGEIPYRAERFFENLTGREPMLRALIYSPVVQAIEFAAATFPIIQPQPKLIDAAPRLLPAPVPAFVDLPSGESSDLRLAALFLTGLGIFLALSAHPRRNPIMIQNHIQSASSIENFQGLTSDRATVIVQNLTKRYGRLCVLENVSFKAMPGEAIALWGANGAGKTTLIKAILGLIEFQGDIQVEGWHVRKHGKQVRSRIGYVPQEFIFYDMTVQETLTFYARLRKVGRGCIPILAERLGLSAHLHKPVSTLSGGLKQRLALAVALLADPPILLLDEPMASLDTHARNEYLSLIMSLRRAGKTILYASHHIEEVEFLADRVLVLESGQLEGIATPQALRERLFLPTLSADSFEQAQSWISRPCG